MEILKERLDKKNFEKINKLNSIGLRKFLAEYIQLCNPYKIFVSDDCAEDLKYIRESALKNKEESKLRTPGHTIHFDSFHDQGRDKENTCILVDNIDLGYGINTIDRFKGLYEIQKILKDIMKGNELYICFFCLGPRDSAFSIPCVQLTDSSYVAHSEYILYRPGYDEFIKRGDDCGFFKFVHSQGELDEKKVCKNLDKRRIYIDIQDNIVYSANTQYGGNSIGLKKLAMRLAINKSSKEGWLTEHMLIMGINGPEGRVTYFTGAFPSLCGKTSTAMLEGEKIAGDDIAYIKKINGAVKAVNAEKGMFGIIQGINSIDDPIQWKALHSPGEVIFSNVLVSEDKNVFWIGKDVRIPDEGYNHSGKWEIGKKDEDGNEITSSHPNARFTLDLKTLENIDSNLENPGGIEIGGIVYGGRDSDTWVPVEEAFDWAHGIITKGASLESETTAATLGEVGIRKFNPMSNMDFLSIPVGKYIQNNLNFCRDIEPVPLIFSVNYFLKNKKGDFLNEKTDKKIWFKWMELRCHREVNAIKAPTGFIPKYSDLKKLFKEVLDKEYSKEDYNEQFAIKVKENLEKIERIKNIYKSNIKDAPQILFQILDEQKIRLIEAQKKYGDYILPENLTFF